MKSRFSRPLPAGSVVSTANLSAVVQAEDFDIADQQSMLLSGSAQEGAIATFTGYVRRTNGARQVLALELEHYPGMTERSVLEILQTASDRWPIFAATAVHRVGKLAPGEQIVWVGVSASHRAAAFSGCEFIMDFLKTRAPFWKKEWSPSGASWVQNRKQDSTRAARWGK